MFRLIDGVTGRWVKKSRRSRLCASGYTRCIAEWATTDEAEKEADERNTKAGCIRFYVCDHPKGMK